MKEIFKEYGITRDRFFTGTLNRARGNQRVVSTTEATYDTLKNTVTIW